MTLPTVSGSQRAYAAITNGITAVVNGLTDTVDQLVAVGSGPWASTLDGTAASGQKVIPTTTTPDASALGASFYIGAAGSGEVGIIESISAGVSITAVGALGATYSAGAPISITPGEVSDARSGWPTLAKAIQESQLRVYDSTRYASLQAAIDDAESDGGGVVLVRGSHTIADKLYPAPGVHLRGIGYGSVLSFTDNGASDNRGVEFAAGTYRTVIENLRITSTAGSRTGLYGLIRGVGAIGVTVRGCWIDNSPSTAIWTAECEDWDIDGNRIGAQWADGIHITRASKRVRIRGNEVAGTRDDGIAAMSYKDSGGSSVGPNEDIIISGNTIHDITTGSGIAFRGGDRVTVQGNSIARPAAGAYMGVMVAGEDDATYHGGEGTNVSGNQIKSAGQEGIYVYGVTGGIFNGNSVIGSGANGIFLLGSSCDNIVSGNYASGNAAYGIAEQAGSNYNVYVGNRLPGNTSGAKIIGGTGSVDEHNL